jgi:hypothetical protein
MKRIFIGLTVAALATILVPMSVHANALAFDAAGNLYVADPSRHSVFKYTPDGTKSSFATELKYPLGLCFDGEGNLFVSDGALTEASFLFTLKFDAKGNVKSSKCVGSRLRSSKRNNEIPSYFRDNRRVSCCFSNAQKILTKGKHRD